MMVHVFQVPSPEHKKGYKGKACFGPGLHMTDNDILHDRVLYSAVKGGSG